MSLLSRLVIFFIVIFNLSGCGGGGSSSASVNASPAPGGSGSGSGGEVFSDFSFTPDGSQVVYYADEMTNGINELFVVDTSMPGLVYTGRQVLS